MAPQKPRKSQEQPKPFDVYASSSTGHQIGDGGNRITKTWVVHRTKQLQLQFSRTQQGSITTSTTSTSSASSSSSSSKTQQGLSDIADTSLLSTSSSSSSSSAAAAAAASSSKKSTPPPQIFENCCVYVNGLLAPGISDLDLRHKLVSHGARIAIQLAKKTVTHVVVSEPSKDSALGIGGGLAAGKLQKEIKASRNRIRYVKAEWVLDSIAAKRRLAESKYSVITPTLSGQKSILQKSVSNTSQTS